MVFKPSSYENKGNWKKGHISEEKFRNFMNDHVDFIVGDNTPVDLKGDKNTDAVWLEIKNVWGGKGSLFGKAKYIVIEYLDINTYIFYDRLELVKYIKRFKDVCKHKSDYHCLYTRKGNKDQIVKVKEIDIRPHEKHRFQYNI